MRPFVPIRKLLLVRASIALRRSIRGLVVAALCLGLVLMSPGVGLAVFAQQVPLTLEAAEARLDRYMTLIERLQGAIDRTQFDLSALRLDLSFAEPEAVIAFVRDGIAFEQYPGLLRGAEGTLMGRAGNALDQAVLLDTLLADLGAETRLARGTLSEPQAQALVRQMLTPGPAPAPVGNADVIAGIIDELASFTNYQSDAFVDLLMKATQPTDVSSSDRFADADATARALVESLRGAGIALGDDQVEAKLVAEAADYLWLEYRFGPTEAWQAAHPAAGDLDLADLEAAEYFSDGVPESLQHRLRMEVVIERSGDGLLSQAVMAPLEHPVADLVGVLFSYSNAPDGATGELDQTIADMLEATTNFLPILDGELAPGGQFFDLSGNLKAPSDVVAELGQDVGGAFGGFGLGGGGEPETTLSAQWIDYTLIAPGGEETRFRRTVMDRIGMDRRLAGEISPASEAPNDGLALIAQQRFMVAAVDYPLGFILDTTLQRLQETRPLLEFMLAQAYEVEAALPDAAELRASSPVEHLVAYNLFDGATASRDGPGYRAEPSLLVFSSGFRGGPADAVQFSSIDIVNNAKRIFDTDGQGLANDGLDAVRAGVWETLIESDLVAGEEGLNTARLLDEADEAGIAIRVIAPGASAEVDDLDISAEARANLVRDLEAGFAVLVPEAMPTPGLTGWWRVDPLSGETLGMTSDGRGQDFIEYAINVYDKAATLAFALAGIEKCLENESGLAQLCCLMKVYMNTVYGIGIGLGVSAFAGSVAGLGFTLITGFAGRPGWHQLRRPS